MVKAYKFCARVINVSSSLNVYIRSVDDSRKQGHVYALCSSRKQGISMHGESNIKCACLFCVGKVDVFWQWGIHPAGTNPYADWNGERMNVSFWHGVDDIVIPKQQTHYTTKHQMMVLLPMMHLFIRKNLASYATLLGVFSINCIRYYQEVW